jgi:hypothetical protein
VTSDDYSHARSIHALNKESATADTAGTEEMMKEECGMMNKEDE